MTKKQINYILRGMYAEEPEVLLERLALVISARDEDCSSNVLTLLTDGIPKIEKVDYEVLSNKLQETEHLGFNDLCPNAVVLDIDFDFSIIVKIYYMRKMYKKVDGKNWDFSTEKTGEYSEEFLRQDFILLTTEEANKHGSELSYV